MVVLRCCVLFVLFVLLLLERLLTLQGVRSDEMGVNLSEFKSVEMNMTAPRTWTIEQVKDWLTECFGLNPEVHTGDGYSGEDGEVDGDEENGYSQNQMEEEDTEGESDADDSDESDDGEEVPIPGRWNHNFSSAMTINDGLDSNWEYHQNNVAVGAMFPSKRHMQDAIMKWEMASQRQLRTTVSSEKYLTMECVDINCPGRVHGYVPKYDTTWRVSDFVAHSCELASILNDHCNLSSNLIARLLYTEIVEGQAMRVNAIQKNVKKHHFYTISYGKAWRAKQRAMEMRFGSFRDAYDAVVRLLQTLQARNPDTYVNIQDMFLPEYPSYRVLHRVYFSFGVCIESFRHCRPVLCVDGTFLTGQYKGQILTAIGMDGNNQIVPLAFAFVEHEPTERWSLLHDTHGARYVGFVFAWTLYSRVA
nr:uncharacterized protein LOC127329321 [Lolium perenne]